MICDEFGTERWWENCVREEGVAVEVAVTGSSRVNVLPVVDEDKEFCVSTGGTEMFHDLDPGAPGLNGEVSHVMVLGDDVSRRLVVDVVGDAGDELSGLTVMDESEVTCHDGDGAGGEEETGDHGVDDCGGSMKEHGSLGGDGEVGRR